MSITQLPVKTLVKVLAHLRGGEIGFDPYRDPRTSKKEALLAFILQEYSNDAIIAAVTQVSAISPPAPMPPLPVALSQVSPAIGDPRLAALQALLAPPVDEAVIERIVQRRFEEENTSIRAHYDRLSTKFENYDAKIEAITNRKPIVERIVIEQAGKPEIEIREKVNPVFHEVLAMAAHYSNIMLVGPAGCGKTHLARQVALALGKSFSTLSCSAGTPESAFTGRLLPTGDGGKFEYLSSSFLDEYQKDEGCFLIDEYDALDPSCHMVTNGATANGGFTVDMRKAAQLDPYVKRGERSLLIASANTYSNGADAIYTARFQQDASAPDRWYTIPMDYDRDLEATLAPDHLCDWVWSLRDKAAEHRIRRVVSTRMIQKANAAHQAQRPMKEIKERMLAGWTREERAKCGV